ncbi:Uncharacterised protein [Klebsiella pneumoniae]|nr:Uncharacterised protein [Klebsiella pneumoniae]
MPNRCANRLTFSGIHHADELKRGCVASNRLCPDWIINNIARFGG